MSRFLTSTRAGCRRSFPRHLLHRITTLAILACLLLNSQLIYTPSVSAESSDPPNIILIMADDIGYECFGCYGSRQYRTPNIDRMAQTGIRFSHCYSQPLCTPSRVKLMTGLSNVRNYSAFSILNRDQKTIAHRFREAGYATAVAGKWQLLGAEHYAARFRAQGTLPQAAGFQNACLWQVDRLGKRYQRPLMYVDGKNQQFDEHEYGPRIATDYLIRFMRQHRARPFFVYYPMILVHSPFVPTPDSEDAESKDRQRNFEDMVAYMDKLVGQILRAVDALGLSEKTLVMFSGDNGTHKTITSSLRGRTIQGGKGLTTDAGTRVPLVARWPGVIEPGRTCDDLIDFADFLPTVLEAAGHAVTDPIDGRSFLPQLRGEPGQPREWIHCYYCPRPQRSKPIRFVRDHRWKLYDDGRFYDVRHDVLEAHPLQAVPPGGPAATAKQKLSRALASLPATGQTLLQFAD